MVDPRVILIAAGIYGLFWLGGESIKGVRWVKHHVQSAVHHVLHPHEQDAKK